MIRYGVSLFADGRYDMREAFLQLARWHFTIDESHARRVRHVQRKNMPLDATV